MVIYFLQRINPPVLPVLHEKLRQRTNASSVSSDSTKKLPMKKSKNKKQSAAANETSTTDNELYDDIDLSDSVDEALSQKNFENFKRNLQDYVIDSLY
jgi:hypothetical protein